MRVETKIDYSDLAMIVEDIKDKAVQEGNVVFSVDDFLKYLDVNYDKVISIVK